MSDERSGQRPQEADDFFLPDLCQAQSILFLVLVAELLVFVVVLVPTNLVEFSWTQLGLTSLFVQWVVLLSAAILCNMRPILSRMSTFYATVTGYGLILSVTLVFSVLAEWLFLEDDWGARHLGAITRNLLVAAVMTGIAFRYFFLQHRLRRQEQAELNSRIQALQSRIRPHFLFNSMNIIASLIPVDPETAESVVEDLSVLFRASLNDSSSEPVTLAEELDLCEKYVHIEALRLDDRLDVDWDVQVDTQKIRIPMLTLQPLIENAIYHGIQPNPKGGTVVIRIFETGVNVVVEIENPLPEAASSHERGNRMALDNIRRRLEAIYGADASLTTASDHHTFRTRVSYPFTTR
ncbi:MAG: histidine kinase [Pseudomonadales bacterium]|nr:histidine kinase [Pseudomonadales bacterium]